jgi:hypothetical protein
LFFTHRPAKTGSGNAAGDKTFMIIPDYSPERNLATTVPWLESISSSPET